MTMVQYFISTGKKQVMYTLWRETFAGFMGITHYSFVKILAMTEAKALKAAQEYANEHGGTFEGIDQAPRFKKSTSFDMYGMHFAEKRKHGKAFFMGIASQDFWQEWREKKEEMKQSGFSVSKWRDPRKNLDVWYVFYREGK